MRFSEILHLVWMNISENKTKVLLTSLGVIVGAATIVLVIAIGNGGKQDVQEQFKTLNVGAIEVSVSTAADMQDAIAGMMPPGGGGGSGNAGGATNGGGAGNGGGGNRSGGGSFSNFGGGFAVKAQKGVTLTATDVDDLISYVPDLTSASIISSGTGEVLTDQLDAETDETIVGCLPDYQSMSNLKLLTGNFISQDDQDNKSKVAVVGYKLAKTLFGSAYAANGADMTIEGKTYTVEGVLDEMGTVASGISPDDSIYLPYATANKFVLGSSATPKITAIASDVKQVPTAMDNIKAVLTENYPNGKFTLTDAGSEMEAATTSANTLSMLLIAVAIIVFIVGGIGIMNVLLMSAMEKKWEIGLRKSIGASRSDILFQFLAEIVIISAIGIIVGVMIAIEFVTVLTTFESSMRVSFNAIVLSVVFCLLIALIFGITPAWKASKLLPLDCLKKE